MSRSLSDDTTTTEGLFGYTPMDSLAFTAMAVFLVLGAGQAWTNRMYRPCKFMLILTISAWVEAAGYGIRVAAAHNPSVGTNLFPSLAVLLVPNAMALVNYIVAGRALKLSGRNVGFLKPDKIAKIFFLADVLAYSVQGFGGFLTLIAMLSKGDLHNADHILVFIGLVVQCITLVVFIFVMRHVHRTPEYLLSSETDGVTLLRALYISTSLILLRCVFRVVEYAPTLDYVKKNEWFLYGLDFLPIAATFVLYLLPAFHYGRCLNSLSEKYPAPEAALEPDVEAAVAVDKDGPERAAAIKARSSDNSNSISSRSTGGSSMSGDVTIRVASNQVMPSPRRLSEESTSALHTGSSYVELAAGRPSDESKPGDAVPVLATGV